MTSSRHALSNHYDAGCSVVLSNKRASSAENNAMKE